ncbi:MAG: serine acetyltransferase [Deltaproteobacteria bacterium]|nr:serine acetyltransferase [Deltaproteobacteria bacterium]
MSDGNLRGVVDELCEQCNGESNWISTGNRRADLPSRDVLIGMVEDLRSVLFPGYFGTSELSAESLHFHMGSTLDRVLRTLQEQVRRGLCFVCPQDTPDRCGDCEDKSASITHTFLAGLPRIRARLSTDVAAAYEGDPAATSFGEAIFCYPGIQAITNYRLAHELYLLEVPLIPRIITEYAHSITGIDIHPGATIGEKFFIDHGTGIVIGETCEIGDRVRVYQGVTLGAKSLPLDENGNPIKGVLRHPIVEDDVVVYSGATILGRITIGHGSVIGGNVWLTRSISSNSRITQAQVRQDQFADGGGI